MTKELDYINKRIENLEFYIAHQNEYNITPTIKVKINDGAVYKEELAILKKIKKRLEAIDNAKPSEALECLEKLKGMEISSMPFSDEYGTQEVDLNDIRKAGSQLNTDFREYTDTIKLTLLKAQEREKVLEIIINKNVMIYALRVSKTLDDYNELVSTDEQLTKEEFDTLKRWLEDGNL